MYFKLGKIYHILQTAIFLLLRWRQHWNSYLDLFFRTSLGSGEQTTDGRTMFAAGPPGNCCLSNNSHFQQTPIPIFHLVFKIAAESLVPALTCRGPRAKTGKGRSSTLLTQPVSSDWLSMLDNMVTWLYGQLVEHVNIFLFDILFSGRKRTTDQNSNF